VPLCARFPSVTCSQSRRKVPLRFTFTGPGPVPVGDGAASAFMMAGMVMAIDFFQRLDAHAEVAGGFPQIASILHVCASIDPASAKGVNILIARS